MDTASEFEHTSHHTPNDSLDIHEHDMKQHESSPPPHHAAHTHQEAQETYDEHIEHERYEVKTLLAWSAPGRPYQKRSKQYFASVILITVLIEIIIFLFGDYLLMMVVLSLVFVAFALALVPPHNYHYRISSEGVTIEDHFYLWQELYDFYFRHRDNQDILHIRTKTLLPGELTFTLGDIHKDQLKDILIPYLPYREVIHETFIEKSGNWLSKTFPLDKPTS